MESFAELGEFGFIDRIGHHCRFDGPGVLCGIGDDCAVFALGEDRVRLVTTDMMVASVHFTPAAAPEGLGFKLLAVNLSDVAAMGGVPRDAVVSVAVPPDFDVGYMERVYAGLYACAHRFGVAVAGGDTTRSSGPLVLNLALTGEMVRDRVCYRSGARPGDWVYVSGSLGDSAAGLAVMENAGAIAAEDRSFLLRRHHRPEPRVALGQALAASGAVTAMIDVSDGVASDLRHICERSDVGAVVREKELPLSSACERFCKQSGRTATDLALAGGEDFELLFTVAAEKADAVDALSLEAGLPALHRIGQMVSGPVALILEGAGGRQSALEMRGFDHFRSGV